MLVEEKYDITHQSSDESNLGTTDMLVEEKYDITCSKSQLQALGTLINYCCLDEKFHFQSKIKNFLVGAKLA